MTLMGSSSDISVEVDETKQRGCTEKTGCFFCQGGDQMFGPLSRVCSLWKQMDLEIEEQQAVLGSCEVGSLKVCDCECVNLVKLDEVFLFKLAYFDVPSN